MDSRVTRVGLQLFIGGILLASAVGKALDVPGFMEVLKTYRAFPNPLLAPLAYGVIVVEATLGLWVLSGWRLRDSAVAAGIVNLGYALWMALSLVRGLELTNCGCFGVFFPQPLRWYSPLEDLVLVAASVWLWRIAPATAAARENRK